MKVNSDVKQPAQKSSKQKLKERPKKALKDQIIHVIQEESDAESDLSLDFEDQLAKIRKAKASSSN